jgi:hypothetical protein
MGPPVPSRNKNSQLELKFRTVPDGLHKKIAGVRRRGSWLAVVAARLPAGFARRLRPFMTRTEAGVSGLVQC